MLPCVIIHTLEIRGTPLELLTTVSPEGKVGVTPSWQAGKLTSKGMEFFSFPDKLFEFLCAAVREADRR